MRYYIVCPAETQSGGPELAHQMCRELVDAGREAKMYYIDDKVEPQDVEACECYQKYGTNHVTEIFAVEQPDTVVIFNEGAPSWIPHIHTQHKIMWWMSVDNFLEIASEEDMVNVKNEIELHLVQSYYAWDYLNRELGIPDERICYVSDYINEEYGQFILPAQYRKDYILYNPRKGYEQLEPLIEQSSERLQWIPLINLNREQMQMLMQSAKAYVDFGKHPGKDRIPRETASCGCCVITNKMGSAAYQEDVPIPEEYKFYHVEKQYDEIEKLLIDICENYETRMHDFDTYRLFIKNERTFFTEDVRKMAAWLEKAELEEE